MLRRTTTMTAGTLTLAVVAGMAVMVGGMAGCRRGPATVKQPAIDPAAAGRAALVAYDTDGNGTISGKELDASPPLRAALERLDTNKDGGVSADEVAERVKAWKAMQTGLASWRCRVTLDGQPLTGARVVLEPEPFLGTHIKQASGDTNPFGDVSPSVAREELPDPSLPGGVHFGLYRVRITKAAGGKESLPSRFNAETNLGCEVAYDEPSMKNNDVRIELETKP